MLIIGVFKANLNIVASKTIAITTIMHAYVINTFNKSLREIKSNLNKHIIHNTKEYL
jgi:hypothetical protein